MNFEEVGVRADRNFDNFMIGESNKEAYQTAFDCAAQFGEQYNRLWIYSENGLGGSHLLHAIGNELLGLQPNIRIKQIHTERFVNSYRQANFQNEMAKFQESYREPNCLLLDDMQYLLCSCSEHTDIQEEFIHILSTLFSGDVFLAFTADRPINELPKSNIKLLLNQCKQVTISLPEITLKRQLAKYFSLQRGYELPDEIVSFISQQEAGNIRELEGQVNLMLCEIEETAEALNLNFVKKFYLRWYERFYN